jgi:outer membrane protein OmpA-like peptidoglycan-associated protein
MSLCQNRHYEIPLFTGVLALISLMLCSASALGQEQPTPKAELFVGYQWLNPGGKVPEPFHSPTTPVAFNLPSIPQGVGSSLTYNFDPHWGLEGDYGGNWNKFAHESTGSIGPRLTWRSEGVNFFAHTLLGLNRLSVPGLDTNNGLGAILGGGMDIQAWRRLSFRVFEADYVWAHHNYSNIVAPVFSDLARPSFNGARLRTGLVFNFGFPAAVSPAASCSVQPSEVMVGEPVTATATASNFNPKHTLTYSWSSTGGKVTGKDNTATIDTNGIAGGSYTVTAHISDPKMKKGGEASCTANFTVKEPPKNPPTMSCSASPTSVQAGTPATITCSCTSPDNVPVTVGSWSATGGSISGEGNTGTLNTTGAAAGPITISATCTDSRTLTASGSAQVNVEVPPPPPPQASKLSECQFPNERKPWRVDNTCKAVLDDVAQRLQHDPDAKLVIVGNAEPGEKRKNLAAERAVDSKAYLSGGEAKQGIDPSRIEVRTGSAGTKTAEYWIVPAGATFSESGTEPVNESQVKPIPDHPAAPKRKAAKPKAQ